MGSDSLHVTGFQGHLLALNGEYSRNQSETNHGRPLYVKSDTKFISGTQNAYQEAKIYYWDSRDGSDLQGWWCAPDVGSEEVWARNLSDSPLPPSEDWLVPWHAKTPDPSILMELRSNLAWKRKPSYDENSDFSLNPPKRQHLQETTPLSDLQASMSRVESTKTVAERKRACGVAQKMLVEARGKVERLCHGNPSMWESYKEWMRSLEVIETRLREHEKQR